MHFCFTAQYTPHALNAIMENPTTSRYEATKKLVEAAGGKLISMYSTGADGPGVLITARDQQLVLGALKGPAATNSLNNVTRHYDDLSQASVRLGQPVLAPT